MVRYEARNRHVPAVIDCRRLALLTLSVSTVTVAEEMSRHTNGQQPEWIRAFRHSKKMRLFRKRVEPAALAAAAIPDDDDSPPRWPDPLGIRNAINCISTTLGILCALGWATVSLTGCLSPPAPEVQSVSSAWRAPAKANPVDRPLHPVRNPDGDSEVPAEEMNHDAVLALVNGEPIRRVEVRRTLMAWYGAATLDQLIRLELASAETARRGLTVSSEDVEAEHDLMLRRLIDPLAVVSKIKFDRAEAEGLLNAVLRDRNVPRAAYDVITRTNAHFRKAAESELSISQADLRAEFDRVYGRRVQVRHIQLATPAEVARVRERLQQGADFGSLAKRYSAHMGSAAAEGLLAPFSQFDERIPSLFRRTSFALGVGEISTTLRLGEWYHIIKVERFVPPDDVTFQVRRGEIDRILRQRLSEPRMKSLLEERYRDATIEIRDSTLAVELKGIQGENGG